MVFSFSDYKITDRPTAIICTPDEQPIGILGMITGLSADIYYNEMSSISFRIADIVNGVKTPFYENVVGMNIIDLRVGDKKFGKFILVNPKEVDNGIFREKTCQAYSLEYEMTYKKIFFDDGTYNLWNPVSPSGTVVGIILECLPGWTIGEIDSSLIGKYRTFSCDNENVYNFIKNTVQKTYHCIFDFDTYEKKIYVRSAMNHVPSKPVFLSSKNLANEIRIEEDSENIITVLDVNGADGVTIRSVNPMGTNKIYNLDHFMNGQYFSDEMIRKWSTWKSAYNQKQGEYYNLTVQRMIKTNEILLAESRMNQAKNVDLATLENTRSVYIEYIATLPTDSAGFAEYTALLENVNSDIQKKNIEIQQYEEEITSLQAEKDTFTNLLTTINREVAFSAHFNENELNLLNRYFKEDSISDGNFVYSEVQNYSAQDINADIQTGTVYFDYNQEQISEYNIPGYQHGYTITGGSLRVSNGNKPYINAEVIRADITFSDDASVLISVFLNGGAIDDQSINNKGCLVISGSYTSSNPTQFAIRNAKAYLTQNITEYERYSVEKSLYDYGCECLTKLSSASYTFDISSSNFLLLEDFRSFANELEFSTKFYLGLADGKVLEPIFIGFSIAFDNPDSLKMKFSDTYHLSDQAFSLVDILEQSISMGHSLETNRHSYNSFTESGASTSVSDFMNNALDASKKAILSGERMAVSWDGSGIWCRKYKNDSKEYEPEQIGIINNCIAFTDDGWNTAKMAIGCYNDPNLGKIWGVVAPNIVGTLLAGQNLIIESSKKDGGVSVFKVDADGAVLHNARFDIDNGVSHIVLDPVLGFGIGEYPVIKDENGTSSWDETKAKFWVDMDGNVRVKGIVEAQDFLLNGESVLTSDKRIKNNYLDLGNIKLDGKTGDITMTGSINLSGASSIIWGSNKPTTDVTYYTIKSALQAANGTEKTFITADAAGAPNIYGGNIYGARFYAGTGLTNDYSQMDEDGFHIHTSSGGSFDIHGMYDGNEYHFLRISYFEGTTPNINFSSPCSSPANWTFGVTYFSGSCSFSNEVSFTGDVSFSGTVSGIRVVFG